MDEIKEEYKRPNVDIRTPTAIDVAEKLHEQIKEQNDRHEELLVRDEELRAETMLGGQSEAGKEPDPVDPEEEIKNRCNKQLEGTGLSI